MSLANVKNEVLERTQGLVNSNVSKDAKMVKYMRLFPEVEI